MTVLLAEKSARNSPLYALGTLACTIIYGNHQEIRPNRNLLFREDVVKASIDFDKVFTAYKADQEVKDTAAQLKTLLERVCDPSPEKRPGFIETYQQITELTSKRVNANLDKLAQIINSCKLLKKDHEILITTIEKCKNLPNVHEKLTRYRAIYDSTHKIFEERELAFKKAHQLALDPVINNTQPRNKWYKLAANQFSALMRPIKYNVFYFKKAPVELEELNLEPKQIEENDRFVSLETKRAEQEAALTELEKIRLFSLQPPAPALKK